jgi:membrane protease YdiL (CAAX protease family)
MEPAPSPAPGETSGSARRELVAWLVTMAMLACTLLLAGLLQGAAGALLPGLREAAVSGGRIRWSIARSDLAYGAGALAAMLAVNGTGSWLMSRTGERYAGFPSLDGPRLGIAAAFACAVVLAPIAEELYFREALLSRVFARSARPCALAVTALVFAGLHAAAGGPVLVASLSILGVILGWVRLRTGSIGAAIAVHAAHNALAWCFAAMSGAS